MENLDSLLAAVIKQLDTFQLASLYDGFHVLSDATVRWRRAGGGRGWSKDVETPTGEKAFSDASEQAIVEEFFSMASDWAGMAGGAPGAEAAQADAKVLDWAKDHIDPQKISLDLAYNRLTTYMDSMDAFTKDVSRHIGVVKFQNSIPSIPLHFAGIPYEISPRTLIPLIVGFVEMVRIMSSMTPLPLDFLRVPTSILAAILDIGRGDWKNAILSAMGVLGRTPAAFGIVLKLFRDVILFMSPDISTELRDLLYRSTKSFFAGVIFWSFSTFAPEPILLIVQSVFAQIGDIIRQINESVDSAEQTVMSQIPDAMRACYDIKFRRIPEEFIPDIDNLEALQAVFHVPEIYCNKTIRDKIAQLSFVPPVRLMLELLNVPTIAEDFDARCGGVDASDAKMEDAVLDAMRPIVTMKPECTVPAPAPAPAQI